MLSNFDAIQRFPNETLTFKLAQFGFADRAQKHHYEDDNKSAGEKTFINKMGFEICETNFLFMVFYFYYRLYF